MRRLIRRFQEIAAERGILNRYLFQNHAFEEQDVFRGYGAENLGRLKRIRSAVDLDVVYHFFKLELELFLSVKSEF